MSAYDEIAGEACTDCLMLIANGETEGNTRCETEEGERDYLAAVDERVPEGADDWFCSSWPGTEWTDEDRYYGRDREACFSWSACDVCGSHLGGDRYPVVALVPKVVDR